MRLALAAGATSAALALAASGAQAAKVVPGKAVPGATVELRGDDVSAKGKVKVAGKNAEVVSRKGSRVRFVVPRVRAGERPVRMGDAETTMQVLKRFRGKVGVDLAKRTERKKIGADGGSITAKHDGITYKLDVAAGALTEEKRISMTPVSQLKNLPLTRNRPAAVQLGPNGLRFRAPAELSITGLSNPGRQDGFTMTDNGRGFELVETDREGKSVVVRIDHFSTPGAGGATQQDYVNFLTQFIISTPAILTRAQVETLLIELDIARERFENFCVSQDLLCEIINERVFRSLRRLINEECARQTAQPSAGGLAIIFDLVANLQLVGENDDIPACVHDILEALAEPAIQNVATAPFEHSNTAEFQLDSIALADLNQDGELAWIEWVEYLSRWAQRFGPEDLASDLVTAFTKAMDKALVDGKALCQGTDPEEGRALLERGFAIANPTGYRRDDFAAALFECGCGGASASVAQAEQCVPLEGVELEGWTGGGAARVNAGCSSDGSDHKQQEITPGAMSFDWTGPASLQASGSGTCPIHETADPNDTFPVTGSASTSGAGAAVGTATYVEIDVGTSSTAAMTRGHAADYSAGDTGGSLLPTFTFRISGDSVPYRLELAASAEADLSGKASESSFALAHASLVKNGVGVVAEAKHEVRTSATTTVPGGVTEGVLSPGEYSLWANTDCGEDIYFTTSGDCATTAGAELTLGNP